MATAFSVAATTTMPSATAVGASLSPLLRHSTVTLLSLSYPNPPTRKSPFICCAAAKQPSGPVKKRPNNRRKKKKTDASETDDKRALMGLEDIDDVTIHKAADPNKTSSSPAKPAAIVPSPAEVAAHRQGFQALPLPKPPAGFVLDDQGRVLMASNKRIATIVDPTNNYPLECIIRRVFRSSRGDECMLLCPVDTPVQILKSTNIEGWSALSDEEVEAILPTAAYALAKIHMHLVYSGFCYTARGGFCYTEDDIFDFRTDGGEDVDGLPTEGVEITSFHLDGSHYMIYTPSDPLLFVSVKDHSGQLQIADDELLEDPAIVSAIDEETEFNALVEEEAALLESLLGER